MKYREKALGRIVWFGKFKGEKSSIECAGRTLKRDRAGI